MHYGNDFTCKEIFYEMPVMIKIIEEEGFDVDMIRNELRRNKIHINEDRFHYLLDVLKTIMDIKKPAFAGKTEVLESCVSNS